MSVPNHNELLEEQRVSTNSPASMLSANMDAASLLDQSETPDEARKRSVSWPVAPSMSGGPDALSPLATSPNAAPPHVSNLQPASSPVASPSGKSKKAPRRNPWGAESYADLISKAILSTKDKRMTLNQIYEWMVDNVAHFKDKGDSNSAAGWKNSVRHNLSLHPRFIKVPNEQTGKSSWWMINPDAKRNNRRRALSLTGGDVSASPVRARRHPATGRGAKKPGKCGKPLKDECTSSSLPAGNGSPAFSPPHLSSPLLDNPLATNSPSIGVVDSPLLQDEFDPNSPLSSGLFMSPSPSSFSATHFDLDPSHHSLGLSGSEGSSYGDSFLAPSDILMPTDAPDDQLAAAGQIPQMPQLTNEETLGGALSALNLQQQPDSVASTYRAPFKPILTPVAGTPWDTPLASIHTTPHHTPPPMARHQHYHAQPGIGRGPHHDPYFDMPSQQQQQRGSTDGLAATENTKSQLDMPDRPHRRSTGQFPSPHPMPSRERSLSDPSRPNSNGSFATRKMSEQSPVGDSSMSPPPLISLQTSHHQAVPQTSAAVDTMMFPSIVAQQQQQTFLATGGVSTSLPCLAVAAQPPSYHGAHQFIPGQEQYLDQGMMLGYSSQDPTMVPGLQDHTAEGLMPFASSVAVPQLTTGFGADGGAVDLHGVLLNGGTLAKNGMEDGLVPHGMAEGQVEFDLPPNAFQQQSASPNAPSIASSQSGDMPMQLEFNFEHFSTESAGGSGAYPAAQGRNTASGNSWLPRRMVK